MNMPSLQVRHEDDGGLSLEHARIFSGIPMGTRPRQIMEEKLHGNHAVLLLEVDVDGESIALQRVVSTASSHYTSTQRFS